MGSPTRFFYLSSVVCPLSSYGSCKSNFTASYNDELAEIEGVDEGGNTYKVVFNKIYGKDSTFVLDMEAKKIVQSAGEAVGTIFDDPDDRRRNFFGD